MPPYMASLWAMEGGPNTHVMRFDGFGVRVGPHNIILPNDTASNVYRLSDLYGPHPLPHVQFYSDKFPDHDTQPTQALRKLMTPLAPNQGRYQQPVHNVTDVWLGTAVDTNKRENRLTHDYKFINERKKNNTAFAVYTLKENWAPKPEPFAPVIAHTANREVHHHTTWPVFETDRKKLGKDCHLITYSFRPRAKSRYDIPTQVSLVSIPIHDVHPNDCVNGRCLLRTRNVKDQVCYGDKGSVVHCKNGGSSHKATHIVESRPQTRHCSTHFHTAHLSQF